MALILCIECNNQVSDKASACPKCGYPLKENKHVNLYDNGTQTSAHNELLEITTKASEHVKNGDYEIAIKLYQKAIAIDPTSTLAQYNLGCALTNTKDYNNAIAAFNIVIATGGEYVALAYYQMGVIYNYLGQLSYCDDVIERLQSIDSMKAAELRTVTNRHINNEIILPSNDPTSINRVISLEKNKPRMIQNTNVQPSDAVSNSMKGCLSLVAGIVFLICVLMTVFGGMGTKLFGISIVTIGMFSRGLFQSLKD